MATRRDMPQQQIPLVLALVIANNGYYDAEQGNYVISGTITSLEAVAFPCVLSSFCVYVALTGGRDTMAIKTRLIDADEEGLPLFSMESAITFPDPLRVIETMFVVPRLVMPISGEYRLQVLAMNQLLQERRLVVTSTEGGTV